MLEQIKKKPISELNAHDIMLLKSNGYTVVKTNNKVIAVLVKSFK